MNVMNKVLIFPFFLSCFTLLNAQNKSHTFDGTTSFIEIGSNVATGTRTIEAWFQLTNNVSSTSLSDFLIITQRNTFSGLNENEFMIGIDKRGVQWAGHLRFKINEPNGTLHEVVSDSTSWQAGRWYHVAGVVDTVRGMELYIDGVKQNSTDTSWKSSISVAPEFTAIGRQGNSNVGYFEGEIDEVRFSSVSRYSGNFTPICLYQNDQFTNGLYRLDTIINSITPDSSSNGYNGAVSNTVLSNINPCLTVGIGENISSNPKHSIYPNPVAKYLTIEGRFLRANLYSIDGRLLLNKSPLSNSPDRIDMGSFNSGIYILRVIETGGTEFTYKILKK
jgi:hypothetical protein